MSWTCTKCQNVNPSGKCMCLKCSSGRLTGLSLEGLVAPLEADNAKLRERVRELEAQAEEAKKERDQIVRNLEYMRDEQARDLGELTNYLAKDGTAFLHTSTPPTAEAIRRIEEMRKVIAQAQKPAVAAERARLEAKNKGDEQMYEGICKRLSGERDAAPAEVERLKREVEQLQKDVLYLAKEAAERRQPVDRERAIEVAKHAWHRRERIDTDGCVAVIVDAILGAAKDAIGKEICGAPYDWRRKLWVALSDARDVLPAVKPDECDGACSTTCEDCRKCKVEEAIENIDEAMLALGAAKAEPAKCGKVCTVTETVSGASRIIGICSLPANHEPEREHMDVANNLQWAEPEPPAFTPAPTGEAPSADTLARIRAIITSSSSPTDAAPRIYALFAADHAAMVKRVRELETSQAADVVEINVRDKEVVRLRAEVERLKVDYAAVADALKVELARAKESRRCPADGMSAREVFGAITDARVECNCDREKFRECCYEKAVAKARELFTPAAPAKDERIASDPSAKGAE